MYQDRVLTPDEAEAVVDQYIEQFGLGTLRDVSVRLLANRRWRVRWDHSESEVGAMAHDPWNTWLTEHVGTLYAGDLGTTES